MTDMWRILFLLNLVVVFQEEKNDQNADLIIKLVKLQNFYFIL